jgi:hypothetical protein
MQKDLQAGKERWRGLLLERRTLQHRISAPQPLPVMPQPALPPRQAFSAAESTFWPSNPLHALTEESKRGSWGSGDCRAHRDSQDMSSDHQMVPKHRPSRYHVHAAPPASSPIPTYKSNAKMSFSALSRYMTPQEFRSSCESNHQELRHGIQAFQTETAQRLGVPISEICWHLEWPLVGTPQCLCTRTVFRNASYLSTSVGKIALTLECLFLVLEHEELAHATTPYCNPPVHPTLDKTALSLPPRPQPPDAAALASALARCGFSDFIPVEDALRAILGPLLRKFKGLLPRDKWLAVCMQSMHTLQAVVESLRVLVDEQLLEEQAEQEGKRAGEHQVSLCMCFIYISQSTTRFLDVLI